MSGGSPEAARRFHYREAALLARTLQIIGSGLCHQLPERSYFGGGVQVPVCARDTGIYVGFVVSFSLLWLLHRDDEPQELPPWYGWIAIIAGLLFMAWDGFSSYGGIRTTTNDLRLASGIAVGFACAALILPLLVDATAVTRNRTRVLAPAWRFGVWAAAMILAFVGMRAAASAGSLALPLGVTLCIFATFVAVNAVISALLPPLARTRAGLFRAAAISAVACALTVVEIAGAAALRLL